MSSIQRNNFNIVQSDSGYLVINLNTNTTEFELSHFKKKRKKNKKLGCLLAIISVIMSADLDIDPIDSRVNHLILNAPEFDKQTQINRVRKGVEITENNEELGSLKFKKRELICKYTVKVGDEILGILIPKNLAHSEIVLKNNTETLAKLVKSSKTNSKEIGTIELYKNLKKDEFKVLIGAVLLWI